MFADNSDYSKGGRLKLRWLILLSLVAGLLVSPAHAQTTDYHLGVGMRLDRNQPPEVVDMSWATDGPFGPVMGKKIQVFILRGAFGRQGVGDSLDLPESDRIGLSNILMFEDGRWQPLRPLGLRYGLEIGFAQEMARQMEGETIGIIFASCIGEEFLSQVERAKLAAPCNVVACIRLGDGDMEQDAVNIHGAAKSNALDVHKIDISQGVRHESHDAVRHKAMLDKGKLLCARVLEIMNMKTKDK